LHARESREILEEPILYFRFTDEEYRDAGLGIVENTPSEIPVLSRCHLSDRIKLL
jgi:hypothetical protein